MSDPWDFPNIKLTPILRRYKRIDTDLIEPDPTNVKHVPCLNAGDYTKVEGQFQYDARKTNVLHKKIIILH